MNGIIESSSGNGMFQMVENSVNQPLQILDPETDTLTAREYEVVRLLAEGQTSKEIAAHIKMSVQTVDASRRQIMRKLKINNLANLVKFAIRKGLTAVDR